MSQPSLQIRPDTAETTGGSAFLPQGFGVSYGAVSVETTFRQLVARREFHRKDESLTGLGYAERSRPVPVHLGICLATSNQMAVLSASREITSYVVSGSISPSIEHHPTIYTDPTPRGPSPESWTIPTWVLLSPDQPDISDALADLRQITEMIRTHGVPFRSAKLIELARKAAEDARRRENEDIEAWAHRLAQDVADADD